MYSSKSRCRPPTYRCCACPIIVVLPHIDLATHETLYNMADDAVNNLITALNQALPRWQV
ncbi:MAG: Glyoxylate/hydroxypyruvate reductase B [Sodalis sp.]|nr:MAG: Glyoxylate/hydroxypyruvate reductase B [Sodalis sp.]